MHYFFQVPISDVCKEIMSALIAQNKIFISKVSTYEVELSKLRKGKIWFWVKNKRIMIFLLVKVKILKFKIEDSEIEF